MIGAAVTLFSGCARTAGPKETLRDYFTAIAEGNLRSAFDLLSARTKRSLDEAAARAGGGAGGFDVFRSRITTGGPAAVPWITPTTLERVRTDVVKADGDTATVRVTSPLGSGDVRLLREGGVWLVDLDL